jgi:hypothetical protein
VHPGQPLDPLPIDYLDDPSHGLLRARPFSRPAKDAMESDCSWSNLNRRPAVPAPMLTTPRPDKNSGSIAASVLRDRLRCRLQLEG